MLQNPCAVNVSSFDLSKAIVLSKIFTKIKLSPSSRLVLMCLLVHWNHNKGYCFPKQNTLAEETGCSRKSITNAINELRTLGLILSTGDKGDNLKYYLTGKFFDLVEITQEASKKVTPPCVNFTHHEQINNNKLNNKDISYKNKNEHYYKPKVLNLPVNMAGQNYVSVETTKKLIEEKQQIKKASPTDDLECAKQWLSSLTQNQLNNPFFKDRANKIKTLWGLKESDILSFNNNKMSLEQNL